MANKNSPPPSDNKSKGRRPTATLDLKATEVSEKPTPGKETAKSAQKNTPKSAQKNAQKSDQKNTGTAKPTGDATLSEGAAPPKKPPPKKSNSGGGGFAGNIFSGFAGGALALLGTFAFQNFLNGSDGNGAGTTGLPTQIVSRVDTLEQRLNSLPKNTTENVQAAENALDADVMEKLAKLGALEGTIENLEIVNAELRARTNAIEKRQGQIAKQDIPDEITNRLRRFEETIAALATTSQNPAQSKVAEIAALVGRINDFEAVLDDKISNLRKSITEDLGNNKVATDNSAALEVIANLKTANQKLAGEIETLKSELARNQKNTAEKITQVTKEEASLRQELASSQAASKTFDTRLNALKSDLQTRDQKLAKAETLKTDIAALKNHLTNMSARMDEFERYNVEQRQNASNVLLSLELSDLKQAIEQGRPYATQLAEIKQLAGDTPGLKAQGLKALGLEALDRYKNDKVLSTSELQKNFSNMAHKILSNIPQDKDATMLAKLMSSAKGVIRIRKTGDVSGNDPESILARMETRLKSGDLTAVLNEGNALPDHAKPIAEKWLEQIEARNTIDRSLAALQSRFKSSLTPATKGAVQ